MTVEAKPPIRRSQGAGGFLIVLAALAVCVPLMIGAAVVFYWLAGFSGRATEAPPQVAYSYTMPAVYEPTISSEFESRLSAAQQIQDRTERDEAFAILAAKHSSHSQEASQALHQIQDEVRRDGAAWDAAKRFSQQGNAQEALNLVNAMRDQKNRDAAFRAIATGEWPAEAPGLGGSETVEAPADEATAN